MSRNPVAELDDALLACTEASVALAALYPLMVIVTGRSLTPEARAFIEDGMEALSNARRHINAAREQLDSSLHSVRVEG